MTRIALLTHSVNPRGGVVHAVELAQALHGLGHDVTVLAPALPGERLFRPLRCGLELMDIGPAGTTTGDGADPTPHEGRLRRRVRSRIDACVAHVAAWSRRREIEVWHAHDGIGGNALSELRRWGLLAPASVFLRTVHHLDQFDDAVLMGWQARSWRCADRVLCVSRLWRDRLVDEEGASAHQVANGVDLARWRPPAALAPAQRREEAALHGAGGALGRLGLRADGQVVLAVGGVEERKNTLRLLQAFAALQAQDPAPRQLVIAGGASLLDHDAYARDFRAALAASGLAWRDAAAGGRGRGEAHGAKGRDGEGPAGGVAPDATAGGAVEVLLAGTIDDALMPALMRRADALAMPSLREGFGLVVLEALACGTPALVANRAPFTEHLDDTLASFVDPQSVPAIAEGLRQLLARGRSASRRPEVQALCERYDWSSSARRHLRHYAEALALRSTLPGARPAPAPKPAPPAGTRAQPPREPRLHPVASLRPAWPQPGLSLPR